MALAAQQQNSNDYFFNSSNLVKSEPEDYHLAKQHTHEVISLSPASNEKPRSTTSQQTQSNSFSSIHTPSLNEYQTATEIPTIGNSTSSTTAISISTTTNNNNDTNDTTNNDMLNNNSYSSNSSKISTFAGRRRDSLPRSQLSANVTVNSAETEPTPYSSDLIPPAGPKRHSTSFNMAPASSFKKSQQSKQKHRNTLARNHTTGPVLSESMQQQQDVEVSEDFEKELSARRKAFRRLSRRKTTTDEDEDRVLMGTLISEGHQNYILMYNMLTGIRIAVGRVSAKPDRPIVDSDFSAAHKLAFDV
jgi:hypothetical protein